MPEYLCEYLFVVWLEARLLIGRMTEISTLGSLNISLSKVSITLDRSTAHGFKGMQVHRKY